ncbi:hypothetical protein D3C85_173160 [compost metagenome]
MPVKKKDLVGQRFERWIVVSEGEDYIYPKSGSRSARWICLCDCGNEGLVHGAHLKNGSSQSCGCLSWERSSTHGLSNTRAYKAWGHMMKRCYNPSEKDAIYYSEKGIDVCERWRTSVESFFEDMGECPEGYELERLDYNKGYSPENCVWADEQTQSENRGKYSSNTSGRTGVTWSSEHDKWRVFLYHKKQCFQGGLFASFEDAVRKREQLELEHLGYLKS